MKFFRLQLLKLYEKIPKIILGVLVTGGASYYASKNVNLSNLSIPKFPSILSVAASQNRSDQINSLDFIADIVESTLPSVVSISSKNGLSTGFIVDELGHIITNAHGVIDKEEVFVKLSNGRSFLSKVIAIDKSYDLALIKLGLTGQKMQFLKFAEISELRRGEFVIALSCQRAGGRLISVGVISTVLRDLGHPKGVKYIQTDAMVKEGNSGGPLVNLHGEVVGVNSLMVSDGFGFAIPSNYCNNFFGNTMGTNFRGEPFVENQEIA